MMLHLVLGLIFAIMIASPFGVTNKIGMLIALAYFFVMYLPGCIWAMMLTDNMLEVFLLANLIGFALGVIPLAISLIFHYPLNGLSFALFAGIQITIATIFY